VLRVEVDVSNGELNVISAKNAVDVRWRALERAVGTKLRGVWDLPAPEKQPPACLHCRSCEQVCPQQIKISEVLADFSEKLG